MRHGVKRLMPAVGALLLIGCSDGHREPDGRPDETDSAVVSSFAPQTAGSIHGVVTWRGELPAVPPFHARVNLSLDGLTHLRLDRENPNLPAIDPRTKGVAGAVVFLRGVDPKRSRPWDHAAVRVEVVDYRFVIRQGETTGHVGFVRRGDGLEITSRQPVFHAVHGRGAAFFGLAFPEPDQVRSRRLDQTGLVELSSGAGYYWMRGYIFVTEHPYYTRTDAQGRFELPQVPEGEYELVCWLPSWKEAGHERDPETGLITRLSFGPPAERTQRVSVAAGRAAPEAHFHVTMADFR